MNSNDESPASETTATEQARTEQTEAKKSSDILNFQDSKTDKETNKSKLSDEKAVPEENSPVSIAESSNTVDKKMESKAVSSADSLSSTIIAKEKLLAVVATGKDEKDVEPVTDSTSSAPGIEINKADSLSVISSQQTVLSKETADSIPSGSDVRSVETPASEKIIPEVYRFGSSSKGEISANNSFQSTIPATATSGLLLAHSGDAARCENEDTANVGTAILKTREPEDDDYFEDNEARASFYISSCSVPGMGEGSEWPSVSDNYRMPAVRPGRHIVPQQKREPRRCLGSKRCHYVIAVITFLTTFLGCIAYHLSKSGKVPAVLKPIGASTAFISFIVCVLSAVYINYLKDKNPRLPIVPNYELLGDVDSVMAMNRVSDPEFYYAEDGTEQRNRPAASEYYIRETQSADALDRRGYGRHSTESLQTDSKRCSDESGTLHSTQPQKKFKAMQSSSGQNVEESDGVQASSSRQTFEEIPLDIQSSDEYHVSETQPLLPKKRD